MNDLFESRLKKIRIARGYKTILSCSIAYAEFTGNIEYDKCNHPCCYESFKKWESGKASPNIESLISLCKFFNCSADYLLGFIEEKTMDSHNICEATGLSENAVDTLLLWNDGIKEKKSRELNEIDGCVPDQDDIERLAAINLIASSFARSEKNEINNKYYTTLGAIPLEILNKLLDDTQEAIYIFENIWSYSATNLNQHVLINNNFNGTSSVSGDQLKELYMLRVEKALMDMFGNK